MAKSSHFLAKKTRLLSSWGYIDHLCSRIIEFIKLVEKKRWNARQALHFYLFRPTRLIDSIKHEHSWKILYVLYRIMVFKWHSEQYFDDKLHFCRGRHHDDKRNV